MSDPEDEHLIRNRIVDVSSDKRYDATRDDRRGDVGCSGLLGFPGQDPIASVPNAGTYFLSRSLPHEPGPLQNTVS
ncbi:MAG: hypothetical protein V5A62_16165 [Haloarculaceae archaeon]